MLQIKELPICGKEGLTKAKYAETPIVEEQKKKGLGIADSSSTVSLG